MGDYSFILATFTAPENIGTNPQSLLWIFPLAVLGAVAYKAMKLPTIKTQNFIKEVTALFAFLVVSVISITIVLYILAWLFTE